jgi:hypothetical protein
MTKIIDTSNDATHVLGQLKDAGIETIIRCITTSTNSEKCLKPAEAKAIAAAGLKLGLVFEIWGGSDDFARGDVNADSGAQHGLFAKNWASGVGAPDGTIIWFAIDNDVNEDQFARFVQPYFGAVRKALASKYRTGIYGCGYACQQCLVLGLADAAWLANAMGWNGSKNFRASNRWRLLQGLDTKLCGLSVDPNDASGGDYGAFVPWEKIAPVSLAPGPSAQLPAKPSSGPALSPTGPAGLDAIKTAIEDLLSKVKHMTETPTSPQPGQSVTPTIDSAALGQLLNGLAQLNSTLAGSRPPQAGAATPPPILSPIDNVLGGQAMVGLKTALAILAYAAMWIMQSVGVVGTATGPNASTTGQVLTALIAAFGGLGLTSKLDRGIQALSILASVLQKLPPPAPPSKPGGAT